MNPGNRTYPTLAGDITVAVENAEQWHALAVCVGRPELAYDGAWGAVKTAAPDGPVAAVLEEMFLEDAADIWLRRLEAHGVPAAVA